VSFSKSEVGEIFDFRISSNEDAVESSDGLIGNSVNKIESVDIAKFASELSEDTYQAATRLRLAMEQDHSLVAVTQVSDEDRSDLLSLELSLAFVLLNGGPVLLIDGDLSTPHMHRLFSVDGDTGLVEMVCSGQNPSNFFAGSNLGNFGFLLAGQVPRVPAAVLSSDHFHEFFEVLKGRFRYIFINLGTLQGSSVAMSFASKVDGVVLALANQRRRRKEIMETQKNLHSLGAALLGAVLTKGA
jgi:Mrp family chromosome partitioning ATPase